MLTWVAPNDGRPVVTSELVTVAGPSSVVDAEVAANSRLRSPGAPPRSMIGFRATRVTRARLLRRRCSTGRAGRPLGAPATRTATSRRRVSSSTAAGPGPHELVADVEHHGGMPWVPSEISHALMPCNAHADPPRTSVRPGALGVDRGEEWYLGRIPVLPDLMVRASWPVPGQRPCWCAARLRRACFQHGETELCRFCGTYQRTARPQWVRLHQQSSRQPHARRMGLWSRRRTRIRRCGGTASRESRSRNGSRSEVARSRMSRMARQSSGSRSSTGTFIASPQRIAAAASSEACVPASSSAATSRSPSSAVSG